MEWLDAIVRIRGSAGILLDVDGTLSAIVERPELAELTSGASAELTRLVGRYRVVAAISGRTPQELRRLIDVPAVRLIGSYGLPTGSIAPGLEAAVRASSVDVDGAWVETKGATIAVHFRAAPHPDDAARTLEPRLVALADAAGMELARGKRVIELVPEGRPLKGGAIDGLIEGERLRAALYAGDDVADVGAFAALDRALGEGRLELVVKVAVRGSETPHALTDAADVVVDGPSELVGLLSSL